MSVAVAHDFTKTYRVLGSGLGCSVAGALVEQAVSGDPVMELQVLENPRRSEEASDLTSRGLGSRGGTECGMPHCFAEGRTRRPVGGLNVSVIGGG